VHNFAQKVKQSVVYVRHEAHLTEKKNYRPITPSHTQNHYCENVNYNHRHRLFKIPMGAMVHAPIFPSSLPAPLLPSPSHPVPSLFLFLSFPSLGSRTPQIHTRCLGERCELSQRGLGHSPSRNRLRCFLALKYDIWWPHC